MEGGFCLTSCRAEVSPVHRARCCGNPRLSDGACGLHEAHWKPERSLLAGGAQHPGCAEPRCADPAAPSASLQPSLTSHVLHATVTRNASFYPLDNVETGKFECINALPDKHRHIAVISDRHNCSVKCICNHAFRIFKI